MGRTVTHDPYDVTRVDVAKFAHSIGSTDPTCFDVSAAQALGFRDVVAPLGYYVVIRHTMANLVPLEELNLDGMSPDLTPPTSYRRRVAAESTVWFHHRIVAGDRVVLVKTLEAIDEKRGRSGPFTALTYRLDFRNQDDALAVVEKYVRVLR